MNAFLIGAGQIIFYLLLMLFDEYLGTLLAVIIGAISLAVWLISHVVEWIEPSRVSRTYYSIMLSGWLAPAVALALFVGLRGQVGWMS